MTGKEKLMDRDEAELLLPFYVNGTLDADDRREFEAVLEKNEDLRLQLEMAREDREFVIADNEALQIPSAAGFNRLLAQATRSDKAESSSLFSRFLGRWEALPPLASAGVAAAAIVLALIQASIIGGGLLQDQPGGGFRTASGGDQPAVAESAGALSGLLVRFDDTATAAKISDLLARIDAQIISGPRAGGLYHIKLNKPVETVEEFDRFIEELNTNSNIILFAQKAS